MTKTRRSSVGNGNGKSSAKVLDRYWMRLLVLSVFVFGNLVGMTSFVDLEDGDLGKRPAWLQHRPPGQTKIDAASIRRMKEEEERRNTSGANTERVTGNAKANANANAKAITGTRTKTETKAKTALATAIRTTEKPKPTDPNSKDNPKNVNKNSNENSNENSNKNQNDNPRNENDKNNSVDASVIEHVHIPRLKQNGRNRRRNKRRNNKPKNDPNRTLSPEEKLKYTYPETAPMSNVSNAVYYRDIPPEYLVPDPARFLWDREDLVANSRAKIPIWMKDYFRWHRYKRDTWNLTGWESERWLISQCLVDQDKKRCGGTADRLKSVQTLLRKAWETKRIYLIRWTRPALLEEFLVPPEGGFDWRVPEALAKVMDDPSNGKRLSTRPTIENYAVGGMSLIRSRFQTDTPGLHYNRWVFGWDNVNERDPNNVPATVDEPDFDSVFPSVWKTAFTPSLPIQEIIRKQLREMGVVPNGYVAAHLRALYKVETRPTPLLELFAENAVACATELWPEPPAIFLASDSAIVLQHAVDLSRSGKPGVPRVVTPVPPPSSSSDTTTTTTTGRNNNGNSNSNSNNHHQPLHLDAFVAPVEDFYATFVDLYLLAMARCITYSQGGFGHWGMLIGGHATCSKRQFFIGKPIRNPDEQLCHFPDPNAHAGDDHNNNNNNNNNADPIDGEGSAETIRSFGDDGDNGPVFLPPVRSEVPRVVVGGSGGGPVTNDS